MICTALQCMNVVVLEICNAQASKTVLTGVGSQLLVGKRIFFVLFLTRPVIQISIWLCKTLAIRVEMNVSQAGKAK